VEVEDPVPKMEPLVKVPVVAVVVMVLLALHVDSEEAEVIMVVMVSFRVIFNSSCRVTRVYSYK